MKWDSIFVWDKPPRMSDSGSYTYIIDSGSYVHHEASKHEVPKAVNKHGLWLCDYCLCGNDWTLGMCAHCGAPMGYGVYDSA